MVVKEDGHLHLVVTGNVSRGVAWAVSFACDGLHVGRLPTSGRSCEIIWGARVGKDKRDRREVGRGDRRNSGAAHRRL